MKNITKKDQAKLDQLHRTMQVVLSTTKSPFRDQSQKIIEDKINHILAQYEPKNAWETTRSTNTP